jgi:selenocysteine-specific elongation factor
MHVLSSAGHVDHGKSSLIERLSGIDPDRLAEEKARGLTIDLGFAWFDTPSGREVGIVDVPGHERFIHNMLAGVGSINETIFVVAANEGWKPQSEEHLSILEMLGARGAVVALTKTDLVDVGRLEEIHRQIEDRFSSTTLAGSQIVPVSAKTGAGIDELREAIDRMLDHAGEPADQGRPRVFLDRAFTIKGVGTVVTGTLAGGSLAAEDAVAVLPAGHRSRVRGIQTHKRVIDRAQPISRVALNLANLERAHVVRGDAVVLEGQWTPSTQLDVVLHTVQGLDHPLRSRGAFKAYVGSAEVDARLTLYDVVRLGAGEEAFARLTLVQPVVAAPLDRFVLRDASRNETIGGGTILDAHPPKARRGARENRVAQLELRASAGPAEFPALCVDERGFVARADLIALSGSSAEPAGTVSLRTLEVSKRVFDEAAGAITKALSEFHQRFPLVRGMPRDDARAAAAITNARLFGETVEAMSDRVVSEGPLIRLATHEVTLSLEEESARDVLLGQLSGAGFSPPALASLIDAHGDALVRALIDAGTLVKVSDDLVLSSDQLDNAKRIIAEAAAREGPLTAARIKELLGTSRKYAIPLLEYLDKTGFTQRRGDLRTVRSRVG